MKAEYKKGVDVGLALFLGCAVPSIAFGRLALSVTLGVAVLLILYRCGRDQAWRGCLGGLRTPLGLGLVALFTWWLVSCALSFDPRRSLEVWVRTAFIAVICFEISRQLVEDSRLRDWTIKVFLSATIIILLTVIFILYVDDSILTVLNEMWDKEMKARNMFKSFSSVLACALPILFALAALKRGWQRIAAILIVPLIVMVIWQNGDNPSRSAYLGVISAVALVLAAMILHRLPNRLQLPVVLGSVVLASIGVVTFLQAIPHQPFDGLTLQEIALPFPDPHRQAIWGVASDIAYDNPIFGVGIDVVNLVPEGRERKVLDLAGSGILNIELIPSHPHNWLLEVAAETGIIGALLSITVVLLTLRLFFVCVEQNPVAAYSGIGMLGGFWSSSLTNFSIWSAWWLASYAVLLSLSIALLAQQKRSGGQRPGNS